MEFHQHHVTVHLLHPQVEHTGFQCLRKMEMTTRLRLPFNQEICLLYHLIILVLENILQKQYSINNGLFKRTSGGTAQISAFDIPPGNNSKTLSVNKGDIITLCLVPIGASGVTATISNVVGADVLASSAQTVSSVYTLKATSTEISYRATSPTGYYTRIKTSITTL